MLQTFTNWNNWLSKRMFYGVLSALFIGFNISLANSTLFTQIAIGLFAYMTFVTALTTSFKEFIKVFKRPGVPLWMLFLIHGGAPVVAWVIGLIFYPQDPLIRLGFLISASIPVAVTSIIWTSLTEGSVPLALVVVTLDTLIVPIILPVFFLLVVGQTVQIDYADLVMRLLFMVTIPSVVGMVIHDFSGGRFNHFAKSVGGFTSKIALFLVILLNAAMVASEIQWNAALIKLLLVVLLLVACGYFLGYLGTLVLKERNNGIISAMIYNVGMRNISFGSLLAIAYFPPAVAVPITFAMIYQQPVAALVAYVYKKSLAKRASLSKAS